MSKRMSVKVEGLEGAIKRIAASGGNVERVLETAVHAGAAVVMEIADANAPKAGVVKKETAQRKPASAVVAIGLDEKEWELQFFETGATAHEITGNPLVFQGDLGRVVTRSVEHPGMAAQPFLRPALDGQKDNAVAALGRVIKGKL